MKLHFDFSQGATRAIIKEQIAAQAGEDVIEQAAAQAKKAGVPSYHHYHASDIYETIDDLVVDDVVKDDMRAVYTLLAEAEANAHKSEVDHIHFHEVGEGARIRNALEICCAIRLANPTRITATPLQVGSGTVNCAHGVMEVPTPATAFIIKDLPIAEEKLVGELCTPTSAAIIKHFVQEFTEA